MQNNESFENQRSSYSLQLQPTDDRTGSKQENTDFPMWSSRFRCIQAYLCHVVSYLSVLRVTDSVGRYGIIIFVPYTFFVIFIGVPAVLVEVMVGRFTTQNVVKGWDMSPPGRGIILCFLGASLFILVLNYGCSVYLLKYFFYTFIGNLPWQTCAPDWARVNCYERGHKFLAYGNCLKNNSLEFCRNLKWESSGLQFWKYFIINKTGPLNISLTCLFLLITVCFCSLIICKGIRSFEKMINLMLYPSIAVWAILVIVSLSVSDAMTGFKNLSHSHWEEFLSTKLWLAGFQDTLYFVGVGTLALTCISSHGQYTDNILVDVLTVNSSGPINCFFVAIPILCIISSMKDSDENEDDEELFKDVIEVFTYTSEAFLVYPYPRPLWCALYYLYCFISTCTSQSVLALAICEAIEGLTKLHGKRSYIILAISTIAFVLALVNSYHEQILQEVQMSVIFASNILLSTITWQFFYGIRKFNTDYYFMMGYPLPLFLKFTWVSVLLLPFLGLFFKLYYRQGTYDSNIVYIYLLAAWGVYVLTLFYLMIWYKIHKRRLSALFTANPHWGPEDPVLKASRAVFDTSTVTTEFMYRQELYNKPLLEPPNFAKQNIVQLK